MIEKEIKKLVNIFEKKYPLKIANMVQFANSVRYCKVAVEWYNVLIKKRFLTYSDVKILAHNIGIETFNTLLEKVRGGK